MASSILDMLKPFENWYYIDGALCFTPEEACVDINEQLDPLLVAVPYVTNIIHRQGVTPYVRVRLRNSDNTVDVGHIRIR